MLKHLSAGRDSARGVFLLRPLDAIEKAIQTAEAKHYSHRPVVL